MKNARGTAVQAWSYLLVVGERPHGLQQKLSDGAQQSHWHPCSQVLLRQVEHTGTGCQLDVQSGRVVLHPQNHQLEENKRILCSVI